MNEPTIIDLYTDASGDTWHILQREGGSLSLYYTHPDLPGQYVVFDPPEWYTSDATRRAVIARLRQMHDAIEMLLGTVAADEAAAQAVIRRAQYG
jgi:hypothetical protein